MICAVREGAICAVPRGIICAVLKKRWGGRIRDLPKTTLILPIVLPASMMPVIHDNSYRIVQGPGFVAISYEMIHETRVIPLDGRPHLPAHIRSYMGDPRGK
jgi:hypothetical protein